MITGSICFFIDDQKLSDQPPDILQFAILSRSRDNGSNFHDLNFKVSDWLMMSAPISYNA
jgi:hypothetical protein